jgi:four helix bundle protein
MGMQNGYHIRLEQKIDSYVHRVYAVTKEFPRDEIYGVTSQFRRSAISVMLNFVEGYARARERVYKNFLEISYGSLQESLYLVKFSYKEGYIREEDYELLVHQGDEIAKMLWGILRKLA